MVYCILYNNRKVLLSEHQIANQREILGFIEQQIKPNYKYKIIFYEKTHIDDFDLFPQDLSENKKHIYIWSPDVVYNNLDLVKSCKNSIVVLSKPTILIQQLSKLNPVNENMAFNNGFFVYYINKERNDITNEQWKLLIETREYLLDDAALHQLIEANTNKLESLISTAQEVFKEIKIQNLT